MKVGIITSDSFCRTINSSLLMGSYNQFRAHGYNVAYILNGLGVSELYDIGEEVSNQSPLDDLDIHTDSFGIKVIESNLSDFLSLDDYKLLIFLYCYAETSHEIEYLNRAWNSADGVIYYASDDEIYYRHYLLNDILSGTSDYNTSKLLAILSGHKYSVDYKSICKSIYHVPIIPNLDFKNEIILSSHLSSDFFLNCHHHHQVAFDYIKSLSSEYKTLIFTNEGVHKYIISRIPARLLNMEFVISPGANMDLYSLVHRVSTCKYYLLPNTYYHTDPWYRTRYVQSVMYTHKVIEAFYADRLILGDLTAQNFIDINSKGDIPFISRSNFYFKRGLEDPMYEVIKKCKETMNEVVTYLKSKL